MANARYQFVYVVKTVVIGLIAGATSMTEVLRVWADEVLIKMKVDFRYAKIIFRI